jgi:SAM-dependent methyltransferase
VSATERYAARVDAILAQRTRLRGPEPPGDPFAGLPADNPVLRSDPRRPFEPNLAILAAYVEPDDVVIDVGGGGGRYSLPLAPRCREVVDIDPSASMLAGFEANARRAEIENARTVHASWPAADPPHGSLALVVHVTYLTRDIVAFVQALEAAASRRVIIVVGSPPPISRNPETFSMVFGEAPEIAPGHAELVNVLWEMGIDPDIRMLPGPSSPAPISPTRDAAVRLALSTFQGHQWAFWPLGSELGARARHTIEARFEELFTQVDGGFRSRWTEPKRDALITWESRR